ncbi:MAG TPA: lipid-A-disaccharide synthase [Aliiroseovarius sp.]|nr:lipid-A-disaccharide synthase [Aliiroseovarius sp.]
MRVFIIAGEASGDKLGAALMSGLKTLAGRQVQFRGIGGDLMQREGLDSLFPMDELSLMGIVEILPKYVHLKRRIRETAQAVLDWPPDVVITIDSPDFCLRVAKIVKSASPVPVVHYVAPSVWAWRPGRAAKMARYVDHVLALLPFEPPYMQAAGMGCDFVGHPVVSEPVASDDEAQAFRARHHLGQAPVLLVLPGSRRGEISRLAPVFGAVIARVADRYPDLRVVVPVAPRRMAMVGEAVAGWGGQPVLVASEDQQEKRAAFRAADGALAASGTVALELAAAGTPMVIAYDMNALSRAIITRLMQVDSVNLVNLVTETRVVPEFIGKDCRADRITPAVEAVLADPGAQGEAMRLTMARLGKGGEDPGLRAAGAVLKVLSSR